MMAEQFSKRTTAFFEHEAQVMRFFTESAWAKREAGPDSNDFVAGNPQEMPLPSFVDALQRWSVPQNKEWFAYKMNESSAQHVIAETLRERRKMPFDHHDILLTTGAFAALSVALSALVDPGDEVIYISPPWFFYTGLIAAYGGTPVSVQVNLDTFDLDLDAIAAAITPKTRAIIINSPNNPTGKIYPSATLEKLAQILTDASQRNGRTIFMLSDEAYCRILYDNAEFYSPTAYYPNTLLIYTYGKTLLTPGQRIGYIALPPTMPNKAQVRDAIFAAQIITGYAFPNALLQHAIGDLEKLSIDIDHLQQKRDRMVSALRELGYDLHSPEGTFYLLPKSPIPDDWAFVEMLAAQQIFCLPGVVVELPGFFRISVTASDAMIERSLPGFAAVRQRALESVANSVKS
jgi:aspartate aminotransferase